MREEIVLESPAQPLTILQLTRLWRFLGRSFDEALVDAGGSLLVWLVLTSLNTQQLESQRQIAEFIGAKEATLSHHLDAMVESGLLERCRDPANRRVQRVVLTTAGEAVLARLSAVAVDFDDQLRSGISTAQATTLDQLLGRLVDNLTTRGGEAVQG